MLKHHTGLTPERWFKKSLFEQLANVGTDVDRIVYWRESDPLQSKNAFERALELLTLTILDPKHSRARRRELARVRECLIDYFMYNNEYGSSDQLWHDYFFPFNYAAALEREQRFRERELQKKAAVQG